MMEDFFFKTSYCTDAKEKFSSHKMIQNLQESSLKKINVKYLVLQTRTYKLDFRNTASDFILYETLVKGF